MEIFFACVNFGRQKINNQTVCATHHLLQFTLVLQFAGWLEEYNLQAAKSRKTVLLLSHC